MRLFSEKLTLKRPVTYVVTQLQLEKENPRPTSCLNLPLGQLERSLDNLLTDATACLSAIDTVVRSSTKHAVYPPGRQHLFLISELRGLWMELSLAGLGLICGVGI